MSTPICFQRDDDPPPRRRVIPVKQVGATDQLVMLIVSSKCHGYRTHWTGQKTVPCIGGKTLCQHCLKQVPMTWRGYVQACAQNDATSMCFIEVTEFCLERLKKLQEDRPTLRGMIVCFSRERQKLKAPVQVTFIGEYPIHRVIPPERSPDETLARIWNLE